MAKRIESPTSINTFKQCKRKYYYQYIEKIPTLSNIHQVRGTIAHSTLENFFDINIDGLNETNFAQIFRKSIQTIFLNNWKGNKKALDKLKLNQDQERFYFEETVLMLMNWLNQFIESLSEAAKDKEITIKEAFNYLKPIREQEYHSDDYWVRGYIDAIHELENEVHLIDYKTNSSFEFEDSIKLQLAIYSLLYFEKHGKRPSKVGIFFLRHKLKLIKVDEELLELAKKEINLLHSHTSKTDHIDDYPKCVGPLCKWSSGQCDFLDICKPFEK